MGVGGGGGQERATRTHIYIYILYIYISFTQCYRILATPKLYKSVHTSNSYIHANIKSYEHEL